MEKLLIDERKFKWLRRIVEDCLNRANLKSDTLKDFIENRMETCRGNRVLRNDAFKAYVEFCIENHRQPMEKLVFYRKMQNRFEIARTASFRYFKDVILTQTSSLETEPF